MMIMGNKKFTASLAPDMSVDKKCTVMTTNKLIKAIGI